MLAFRLFHRCVENLFRVRRKVLGRFSPAGTVEGSLRRGMRELLGGETLSAVDLGGAIGLQPHWDRLQGNSKIHVFEPHPESYRALVEQYSRSEFASTFEVIPAALSGSGGKRVLKLTNCPTGSTIMEFDEDSQFLDPNNSYFFPIRELELDTETLEASLRGKKVARVDLIKLDIQGAELEVLQGMGAGYLDSLLALESEISLQKLYKNGTTLPDFWAFMQKHDFELFDMHVSREYFQRGGDSEQHRRFFPVQSWEPSLAARAWEAEVVFFRSARSVLKKRDPGRVTRLIACYCLYNFYTEAMLLAADAEREGVYGAEDRRRVQAGVLEQQKWAALNLRFFRERSGAYRNLNWGQYMWLTYPTN